jgi:hypothetical protein
MKHFCAALVQEAQISNLQFAILIPKKKNLVATSQCVFFIVYVPFFWLLS